MRLAFLSTSFNDYPGRLCSVVFFPGCDLACRYCHNSFLASGEEGMWSPEEIVHRLEARRPVVRHVVFSGGEALLSSRTPGFMRILSAVKRMGFKFKLDTNGTHPELLARLLDNPDTRPDYVAVDVKAGCAEDYGRLCPPRGGFWKGPEQVFDCVGMTLDVLRGSGVGWEARTTCADVHDWEGVIGLLRPGETWWLQRLVQSDGVPDGTLSAPPEEALRRAAEGAKRAGIRCGIR